jgi:hypothetical protein
MAEQEKQRLKDEEAYFKEQHKLSQEALDAEFDLWFEQQERKKALTKEAEDYIAEYKFMSRQLSLENETVAETERVAFEAEAEIERAREQQNILLTELKEAQIIKMFTLEEYAQKEKDIKKATADYEVEVEKDKNKRILILRREALAASAATAVDFLSSTADLMSTIGEIADLNEKDEEKRKEKQKERTKAMLAVEAAAGIANIWINYSIASAKGFAQMGPIMGIPGAALMTAQAVAASALIAAKAGLAIRNLDKQDPSEKTQQTQGSNLGQKFADGGPVYGSSHAAGGVKIEAEGGEFVINKRSMRNPMVSALASYLNKFGDGGPIIRDFPPIDQPINLPINGPIIRDYPGISLPTLSAGMRSPSSSLSISGSRGSGSFIARASYGNSYSGGSSYSGGMNNSGNANLTGLAAEVAAAIQAIPVYIVESEMTGMQRKVQVREQKFTV